MAATDAFNKWGLGYSGCVGGDAGSANRPSIWVSGIEWGGGDDAASLRRQFELDVSRPPAGFSLWSDNLQYIFDRQIAKLLSAIEGGAATDFRKFAELRAPFVD